MKNPLISVIVPIFNVELYLERCIISIISQTIRDIEIILIDDGSPDRSGQIADEYALKDNRIKVIHKENEGTSSARNAGLEIATGQYVSFIDSDDWIEENMIEQMYNSACKYSSDVVVCGVCVEYLEENKIENCIMGQSMCYYGREQLKELFLMLKKHRLFNYPWNKLYKRLMLIENGLIFEPLMPSEDLVFNYNVFKKSFTISYVNICSYHYIRPATSTSLSSYHPDTLIVTNRIILETELFYQFYGLNSESCNNDISYLKVNYGGAVIKYLYHRDAPFNRKYRMEILRNEFYNNEMIKANMGCYIPKNVLDRIMMFNYKYMNPFLMDLFYNVLFFFRYKCSSIYYKFRNLLR